MRLSLPFLLAISLLAALLPAVGHTQLRSLQKQGTTRAVIVGISEYQDKSIGDLRFAHRDAEAFAAYLHSQAGGGLDEANFRLLTNEHATLGQISAALEWLQEVSNPGDQAIIYFSGHGDALKGGTQEGFMLCYDALVHRYSMTGALSLTTLQNVISTLSIEKGTQVLLLADACRSGGIEDRMGIRGFGQDLARQYSNELKLLSCQPLELSHEGEQWGGGRGVFSYYLIEGLMGFADEDGDEVITLMELEQYVKRKVSQDMRPVSQVPIARGEQTKPVAFVNRQHLTELKQNKRRELPAFKPAAPRANIASKLITAADTNAQRYYLAFIRAIEREDFLAPEEDCAEKWFSLLIQDSSASAIHAELRRTYAAALQDKAQQALNMHIESDPRELTRSGTKRYSDYARYPKYYDRAISLLSEGDHRKAALESRKYLFEGINSAYLHKSVKDSVKTAATFNHFYNALRVDPDNVIAMHYLMSWHTLYTMNYDSAKYYYVRASEIMPDWVFLQSYWGYYLASYFQKPEEAEPILRHTLGLDSMNIITHQALGSILLARNEIDDAIGYFEHLTSLEPTSYLPWLNLGICYLLKKDNHDALLHFENSIALDSSCMLCHLYAGIAHFNMDNYHAAEAAYLKADNLNPNNTRIKSRLVSLYLDQEDYPRVEALCQQLEVISPNDFTQWYFRSCAAARQHRLEDALTYLSKALSANPAILHRVTCEPLPDLLVTHPDFMKLTEKYK